MKLENRRNVAGVPELGVPGVDVGNGDHGGNLPRVGPAAVEIRPEISFIHLNMKIVVIVGSVKKDFEIYRKSVLHLLKYTANLYLSRCSTNMR